MSDMITTPCGMLRGTACQWQGITAYKGIRYATAERFCYPVPVEHWDGIYDATAYGACCYQPRAFYNEEEVPEKAFYYHEFRRGETYSYSEDCLFLNIWAPEDAAPNAGLPVLVYIHGGGFTGGCGHEKHFDGPVWPTKGVIAVTLNYRLGPLGFACLPELSEEAGHTGNYGLYDQVAALKWIQRNIASFGGDPSKVTIMGQSAGAMSVQQLCISPLTDGLFRAAVMSSGGGVSKFMDTTPAKTRYEFWEKVMTHANCKNLSEFRALPAEQLFSSWQAVKATDKKYGIAAAPCIDGALLTQTGVDAVAAGAQKNIPYLIGSTSEDIVPPIIFSIAKKWCRMQDARGGAPCYAWFFDRRLPGDDCGAWHSSDLWYWFGTLKNCWRPFTQKDTALSTQMADYLTNFVKHGDPNENDTPVTGANPGKNSGAVGEGPGDNASDGNKKLPVWLPLNAAQKKVLRLGEGNTRMGDVSRLKLIYTMLTNKAVGE